MKPLGDQCFLCKMGPVTYIFSCFPSAYSLDLDSRRKEGKKEERVSLWMSWNCSRILNLWAAYFPRHWMKGQQLCSVAYWMRRDPEISFQKMKHSAWETNFKGSLQQQQEGFFFKVTVEHKKPCNFSFQRLLVFWYLSLSFNPSGNLYELNWIALICT